MAVQSLCVMGLCVGLRGPPELLRRLASHLDARRDPGLVRRDVLAWDGDSVRRLKYRGTTAATTTASAAASSAPGESGDGGSVRAPALALLLALKRKRTPAGAFELLVRLGAWTEHEDLALLRSGFPLRFTESEWRSAAAAAAAAAAASQPPPGRADVDSLLGIRRDLRGLKVYTVDSASTSEVDDGISVEMVRNETTGLERPRYWIHIADAERWADAEVASLARKRVTSLYIPTGSYPMFPPPVGADLMSLRPGRDACALSLGVELNGDGSVDAESIVVTPSLVRVAYRLTYDEVDEMLEEGAGYSEEWQLGALLGGAILRREFRMRAGSMESLVPNPVPGASVAVFPDRAAPGGIGISLAVQVSHNAGRNRTASAEAGAASQELSEPAPVSSAYLLVTELMILAGEAIAQWKCRRDRREADSAGANGSLPPVNKVRLPFRTQPPPGPSGSRCGHAERQQYICSLTRFQTLLSLSLPQTSNLELGSGASCSTCSSRIWEAGTATPGTHVGSCSPSRCPSFPVRTPGWASRATSSGPARSVGSPTFRSTWSSSATSGASGCTRCSSVGKSSPLEWICTPTWDFRLVAQFETAVFGTTAQFPAPMSWTATWTSSRAVA
jgi:hypothetical protein